MSKKSKLQIIKQSDSYDLLDTQDELEILADKLDVYLQANAAYEAFGRALKLTRSLKRLSLQIESFKSCPASFNGLFYNDSIEELKFKVLEEAYLWNSGAFYVGEAFKQLLMKNSTIKRLQLDGVELGGSDCEAFSTGLKSNQSLTRLSLASCSIPDEGVEHISEALKTNSKITSLDLSLNHFRAGGCKALGELLKENATLTYLNLSELLYVPSEGWKEFFGGLKVNSSLTVLDVNQSTIRQDECIYINEVLKNNKTLMHMDLSSNGIGSDGLNNLFRDIDFKGSCGLLTSINLRNTKLDSKCCETLAKYVSVNDKMTELELSFNNISAEGCKWLGTMLKHNKTLTTLNMTHNKIGSEGAQWLADGLRVNTRLCYVVLQDCAIKSEGCTHLAAALAVNPCLMHVNLNGNDIGAQGCAALVAAMQTNQSVTELSITKDKKISAASLEQLIDAQNRNKRHQRALISNVMTTLVNMARRAEDLVSLLPLEIWLHVFKHVVCGGVPGFNQIALELFTNQIDCRDIASLVKMKIVRKRGKSVLAKPSNDD